MKYLPLDDQDIQLLLDLHKFIYLSKEFIDQYIYVLEVENKETVDSAEIERLQRNNEKNNYRRLSTLEKAGYIVSFALPIKKGHKRPSNVYTLQKFGVEVVDQQLKGDAHWQHKWSIQPPPWYMHALSLAEVVKSFETHAPLANLVVKEHLPEARVHFKFYEKKAGSKDITPHMIKPDGVMVLGHPDKDGELSGNIGIMMEMEKTYADRSTFIRKIEQYNKFFDKQDEEKHKDRMKKFEHSAGLEFPVKAWMILFIGNNEKMALRVLRHLRDHKSEEPLKVASKDDLLVNPFGKVYRALGKPNELTTL
jgi:hypothetical protein